VFITLDGLNAIEILHRKSIIPRNDTIIITRADEENAANVVRGHYDEDGHHEYNKETCGCFEC
jgi:hypothetical protein